MLVKNRLEKLVSLMKKNAWIPFPQSQRSLLYFHEKEMLKRESLCEKFRKRKLEGNLVPYLVSGKIQ